MRKPKKNILVTGVGKGLGRNMVESFSKNGAFVYGITRSKSDLKFFKNLKNVKIFCGDVRNSSIFKKILRQSEIDKRPISGLVNNAGIRQRKKFSQITKKKIKEIFDINFFSVFEYSQMYVKYVKKYKISSSVVNIGSIVGETGFKELSGYSSTKGAIKSLTQCLALECIKDKIRFNVVSPGFIETSYFKNFKRKKNFLYSLSKHLLEFFPNYTKEWSKNNVLINTIRVGATNTKLHSLLPSKNLKKREKLIPIGRMAEPREIAEFIYFLGSDENSYITNKVPAISGGE